MNSKALTAFFVLITVFAASCTADVKYTKQVNVKVPAGQAEAFAAEIHNGNITITGCQTTDCNLTAVITVKAGTEEAAKKISEEIKISLLPEGNSINVKIEKPNIPKKVEVVVDLDVNLPAGMNLSLETHNGDIKAVNMLSSADLSIHNGKIDYTGALADLGFETHNGDIEIHCVRQSDKPCNISAKAHNGSIEFAAPENFSAAIEISTHNGSVHTDLPMTITEKTDKELEGVIGNGRDKLHIETHNGSIKIK